VRALAFVVGASATGPTDSQHLPTELPIRLGSDVGGYRGVAPADGGCWLSRCAVDRFLRSTRRATGGMCMRQSLSSCRKRILERCWGLGFVDIRKIRLRNVASNLTSGARAQARACAGYIAGYVSKLSDVPTKEEAEELEGNGVSRDPGGDPPIQRQAIQARPGAHRMSKSCAALFRVDGQRSSSSNGWASIGTWCGGRLPLGTHGGAGPPRCWCSADASAKPSQGRQQQTRRLSLGRLCARMMQKPKRVKGRRQPSGRDVSSPDP
jgi:hypothetical protein